uniref:ATP synthase F0 subunit 8 n=1 Tax=Sphyraena borealis TaxID=372791 RepID=UPI0028FCF36E|nr:ATP synthase F0 subunit 8 [Sphyraena borealis]WNH37890.1 ATP synthase F0 subunit 8 [Sphyraena borealis]
MPQLDTGPWFLILVFSWSVFLIVLPPKVMAYEFPNLPSSQSAVKTKFLAWFWPWH